MNSPWKVDFAQNVELGQIARPKPNLNKSRWIFGFSISWWDYSSWPFSSLLGKLRRTKLQNFWGFILFSPLRQKERSAVRSFKQFNCLRLLSRACISLGSFGERDKKVSVMLASFIWNLELSASGFAVNLHLFQYGRTHSFVPDSYSFLPGLPGFWATSKICWMALAFCILRLW